MLEWIKGEAVLCAALLLAALSACVVHPSAAYAGYLDYRVLVLLFCLMLVVGGFKSLGIFSLLGEKLCAKAGTLRGLSFVLVTLCFTASMLITNDVSLITFVPFTILVYGMADCEAYLVRVIVLETIAANLGSMLTPIGNPQNLLLFSVSGMDAGSFVLCMLPLTALSYVLILFGILCLPSTDIRVQNKAADGAGSGSFTWRFWLYCALFIVCLGNVFRLYSYWVVLAVVVAGVLIADRRLFAQVDYSLLLTFVGFFIFIGNMKQLDAVSAWLQGMLGGHELTVGVLASQIISNVPAAMLLSGFTTDYKALLYGVNIGGLGTLIASMASLISYRFFVKAYPARRGTYFKSFTLANAVLLVILYAAALLFLR